MWEMSRTVGAVACLALIPAASEARARRPELSECFGVAMTPWDPDVLCVNNPDLVEEELSNNQDNFFFYDDHHNIIRRPSRVSRVWRSAPRPLSSHWLHQDVMTGDWGGLRTRLAHRGILFQGHYVQDTAGNPAGGKAQAVRYAHEFAGGLDIDFNKWLGYDIGILHFLVTQRSGLGLHMVMPALSSVQEIYGTGQTVRLTRLSLEHKFTNYVNTELGWVNTENDFAQSTTHWGMSIYCQFQSNAICGMPQSLAFNSGYGYYPSAHPGAYVKLYPTGKDDFLASFGVYNVDNTIANSHNGWKMWLHNTVGTYFPVQLGWKHGGTDIKGAYPGNIRIGGYWETTRVKTVTQKITMFAPAGTVYQNWPNDSIKGRYGAWFEGDQMIERDRNNPKRGVVAFGSFVWGDTQTSPFPYFATWGFIRKGTFASRPDDTISIGGKLMVVNSKIARYARYLKSTGQDVSTPTFEHSFEVNYGWRPAPWLLVRPGLQYVWRPGGTRRYPNATVLDFETAIIF